MRISFLMRNVWGIGGTTKATLNTAGALADKGHDVTIVSFVRHKDALDFDIPQNVKIVNLLDARDPADGGEVHGEQAEKLASKGSRLNRKAKILNMPEATALLDERVAAFLKGHDAEVLVGTHVGASGYIARYGRRGTVKVAQEHLFLDQYCSDVRSRLLAEYRRLDAIVTTAESEAKAYRLAMPRYRGSIECIPNMVPPCDAEPSSEREKVIMAAGRLTEAKGFDLLVRGFAAIADEYPEWSVRIYGRGKGRAALEDLIGEMGQQDRVTLMGGVAPLDAEWAKSSMAVIPSRYESYGLTLLEAMGAGTPPVCTVVPHGPLEIVDDGVNGLRIPSEDPSALAEAIAKLIDDAPLRRSLAEGGIRTAKRFESTELVGLHENLFERLLQTRRTRR